MAHTDRFFREACDMEVTYLNPFQIVSMGVDVDVRELERVAHVFSEVVGLGLRHRVQCPVEISLVPDVLRKAQVFKRKKPFLVGSMAALAVIAFMGWLAESTKLNKYEQVLAQNTLAVNRLKNDKGSIEAELRQQKEVAARYDQVCKLLEQRRQIPEVLNELQRLKPMHVWLTGIHPIYEEIKSISAGSPASAAAPAGMFFGMSASAAPTAAAKESRKIYGFMLQGCGVSLRPHPKNSAPVGDAENGKPATPVDESLFAGTGNVPPVQVFLENLQQSAMIDKDPLRTGIAGNARTTVPNLNVFTIQVKLQKPIEIPSR